MSSVLVRSNGTKSGSPNSRFHNQHSTTTATCRRGNVLSNAHRQMPPWVLGGQDSCSSPPEVYCFKRSVCAKTALEPKWLRIDDERETPWTEVVG